MESEFARDGSDVVDETEVLEREELGSGRWVDVKIWEWEVPSLLPALNLGFDFWSPQQICPLWSCSSLFLNGHVHVGTAAIVLGAISTGDMLASGLVDVKARRRLAIGESSRHNECVYVYRSHNPCETWYGYVYVSD